METLDFSPQIDNSLILEIKQTHRVKAAVVITYS